MDNSEKIIRFDSLKTKGKKPKITLCIECLNYINLDSNSPRKNAWYNHLCKANPSPTEINPFDGKEKPYSFNDFGSKIFHDKEYDFCHNHNNGKCANFLPKQKKE